jgi:hypothetical protein
LIRVVSDFPAIFLKCNFNVVVKEVFCHIYLFGDFSLSYSNPSGYL